MADSEYHGEINGRRGGGLEKAGREEGKERGKKKEKGKKKKASRGMNGGG